MLADLRTVIGQLLAEPAASDVLGWLTAIDSQTGRRRIDGILAASDDDTAAALDAALDACLDDDTGAADSPA